NIAKDLKGDAGKTGEVLTSQDVNNTTELSVNDSPVASVEGLQVFTSLKKLDLSGTRVSDVSPLVKLPKLNTLFLLGTQVSDVTLSSVAKLAKLTSLDLSDTQVSNVSSLEKLANLGGLGLSYTQVSDVSPLAKLEKLTLLDLSNTRVSDVSALAKLTDLVGLNLNDTQVSDVSPLAELTSLWDLDLSKTQVADVSALAKLANLYKLDLSETRVADVSALAKLTGLYKLDLSGTRVLDLGVLHGLSLFGGCNDSSCTSFAGVRPSAGVTVDGDGSVSMPAPRWLDGTWVAPSSTSPAGGTLDAERGVVVWKTYDPKASYSYDFEQSLTLNYGGAVEFSGHVTGVKPVAKTFAVSFDSAGGSSVASQTVEYGARVSVPKDPVRAGYAFQGWYTAKSGGSKYDFGKPVTGGLTLYARWKANAYTLSFDSAGGSPVPSQTVEYGSRAVRPKDPSRAGYAFVGWYTKDGKAFDFNSAVKSDVSLVARWR
ncbi:InlB B-repeat-containing protein, partial [Bifidobacterium boum]|uniref:InlB B-repeat-containing protein n=1 Tax=Bifidobacterium boum TaxID=78343 RepID=UPI003996BE5F